MALRLFKDLPTTAGYTEVPETPPQPQQQRDAREVGLQGDVLDNLASPAAVDEMPEGLQEEQILIDGNVKPENIAKWRNKKAADLLSQGKTQKEVDAYFGVKQPDMSGVQNYVATNIQNHLSQTQKAGEAQVPTETQEAALPPGEEQPDRPLTKEEAQSYLDAFVAGLQLSNVGMGIRRELPSIDVNEDADLLMHVAKSFGVLTGDAPAMWLGAAVGGSAGAGLGFGVGGPVGGGIGGIIGLTGGAMALPEFIRGAYIDMLEKGEVKGFGDFFAKLPASFKAGAEAGTKGAIVGAATGVVGKVAPIFASKFVGKTGQISAKIMSEIAVMTSVGKALEGETPEWKDFTHAAVLMLGINGMASAPFVAKKLRAHWVKTGEKPEATAIRAETDIAFKQRLLSDNMELPTERRYVEEVGAPEPKADAVEPKQKASKEAEPQLSEAEKTIESGIERPEEPRLPRSLKELREKTVEAMKDLPGEFTKTYINLFNRHYAMKEFLKSIPEKEKIEASKNPAVLIRLQDMWGRTEAHILDGVRDFFDPTKRVAPALRHAIKGLSNKDFQQFERYLLSKHILDVEAAGIKTIYTENLAELREFVKSNDTKFSSRQKKVTEFLNNMLEEEVKAGRVSRQSADNFKKKWPNYVPLFKDKPKTTKKAKGEFGAKAKKELKSSDLPLKPTFESILLDVHRRIQNNETNRYIKAMTDLAELYPEETKDFLTKSKVKPPTEAELEVVTTERVNQGSTSADAFEFNVKTGEFSVRSFKNGKAEYWDIHDENLINMFKSHMYTEIPKAVEFLGKFSRQLKGGILMDPTFPLRNAWVDMFQGSVLGRNGGSAHLNAVNALLNDVIPKSKTYYDWLALGAGSSGAFAQLENKLAINRSLIKNTGHFDALINVVKEPKETAKNPVKALKDVGMSWDAVNRIMESSTRVGLFKQALKKGKDPFEAAISSREDTLDFSVRGASAFMNWYNMSVAYQNVGFLSLARFGQALREDLGGTLKRGMLTLGITELINWLINKDDPRTKRLDPNESWFYWHVHTNNWRPANEQEYDMMPYEDLKRENNGVLEINDGVTLRFKKPPELGLLFSLPTKLLDAAIEQDVKEVSGVVDALKTWIPNFVPTALGPVWRQNTNERWNGSPLIPSHLEGVSGPLQYTDYTTETAKIIGSFLGKITSEKPGTISSPVIVENYVREWTGWLGITLLKIMDGALEAAGVTDKVEKPTRSWKDNPFVASFISRTPSQGAYVEEFYKRHSESLQRLNDIKHLKRTLNLGEYQTQIEEAAIDGTIVSLKGHADTMKQMRQLIHMITIDPEMTGDDKRRLIDTLTYQIMFLAEEGVRAYDEIDAAFEEARKSKGGGQAGSDQPQTDSMVQ